MRESRLFGAGWGRWEVEYYGSGVAVAFVPAVHVTPFASL
jgi:hypothetical protein